MSSPEPVAPYAHHNNSDEINFHELALMWIDGWYWILGTVAVAALVAVAYLTVTTTTYETSFRAVPASETNFSEFNLFSEFSISPDEAYRALGERLSSYQNFKSFVDQNEDRFILSEDARLGNVFNDRFSIKGLTTDKNDNFVMKVTYTYPEGEQGADILNSYILSTSEKVSKVLHSRFNRYNYSKLASLKTNLELQKESLASSREDRLFRLEQAIQVAGQLGIDLPTTPQQIGRQPNTNEVPYTDISSSEEGSLPLYFMGTRALIAERDNLRSSLNQSLNNSEIRSTQEELQRHQRIAKMLDSGELQKEVEEPGEFNNISRVVDVIEFAYPTSDPVRPRKVLVLALSLLLGGILGMMLVCALRFFRSIKNYSVRT